MNRMTWRDWAHSARLAGVALALACSTALLPPPAAAAELPVVRFQDYPGLGNLLIRVARSKGWCQEAGIVCELKQIATAPLGVQALIGGTIDVAQTPIDVVATAAARGAKVRTIVGSAVSNINQIDVAAGLPLPHEDDGYPAIMQDFKGRKIGVVARGSSSEAFFAFLLQQAGLKASDVTYVAVGAPNTAFAALRSKQVDAIVSWEPAGIMCGLTRTCKVVYRGNKASQPKLMTEMYGANIGLVMRADEIAAHPKIAEAIVNVSKRAAAFVNDRANESEVLKISDSYFKFDVPQGETIARDTLEQGLDAGTFEPIVKRSAVKATLQYLKDTGQLTKLPAVDDFVWKDASDQ